MSEYNTASVKTISNAIKRKRKVKRANRFKRWLRRLLILLLLSAIGFGVYTLDQSSLFRLSAISVSNNTLYSDQEITKTLDIAVNDRTWLIHDWFYRNTFNEVNGIESVKLIKKNNVLLVRVVESKPVGILKDFYLLANGKEVEITEFNKHYQNQLPQIQGFDDQPLQDRLAMSMATLKPEILLLIGDVQQVTTTYDNAQIRLLLHDKKQVYSDFRSLELFNNYPLFVDQIAAANNCIYLDFTSRSARSAPCD